MEYILNFLTNWFGAAVLIAFLSIAAYVISIKDESELPLIIRFFLITLIISAVILKINNFYLCNNFEHEPIYLESYDEFTAKPKE